MLLRQIFIWQRLLRGLLLRWGLTGLDFNLWVGLRDLTSGARLRRLLSPLILLPLMRGLWTLFCH